jgi:hypothetical protein
MADYECHWVPKGVEKVRENHTNALHGSMDRASSSQASLFKWRNGRIVDKANGGDVYDPLR